jgi:hypothetical protein
MVQQRSHVRNISKADQIRLQSVMQTRLGHAVFLAKDVTALSFASNGLAASACIVRFGGRLQKRKTAQLRQG